MITSGRGMKGTLMTRLTLSMALLLLVGLVSSCVPTPWDIPHRFSGFGFLGFPLAVVGLAVYFTPTIIGAVRHAKSLAGIVLLNIFLGWTFVGWVAALIWSVAGAQNR